MNETIKSINDLRPGDIYILRDGTQRVFDNTNLNANSAAYQYVYDLINNYIVFKHKSIAALDIVAIFRLGTNEKGEPVFCTIYLEPREEIKTQATFADDQIWLMVDGSYSYILSIESYGVKVIRLNDRSFTSVTINNYSSFKKLIRIKPLCKNELIAKLPLSVRHLPTGDVTTIIGYSEVENKFIYLVVNDRDMFSSDTSSCLEMLSNHYVTVDNQFIGTIRTDVEINDN